MITIRQADEGDLALINRLANEIWWSAYNEILSEEQIAFMLTDLYSEDALKMQLQEGSEFLIVEFQSRPVGFAEFLPGKIFRINKLYILPSQQGTGTGKQVIEHVRIIAARSGATMLELNVNRGNPAVSFYLKTGFEIYRTVDIPYYHFVLNDYVMRKKI